jgi:putative alpha-1,2-mannosidase
LKDYKIKAELTASERVAFHKHISAATRHTSPSIWPRELAGMHGKNIHQKVDNTTLTDTVSQKAGRLINAFTRHQTSKAIPDFQIYENDSLKEGTEAAGVTLNGMLNFATTEGEEVMMKIGISPVSEENALKNIESEIPAWDFTLVADNARAAWDNELGKIKVQGKDTASLRTFYTALYHAFIAPVKYNDNDGSYLGTDKKSYEKANFTNYSVFSLWIPIAPNTRCLLSFSLNG